MPWACGRILVWDATCPDTLVPSHIALASREPGLVAEQAEQKKKSKYTDLLVTHHFVPISTETSGVFGPEAYSLFKELGHRLKARSGDPSSFSYLLQQFGVTIQRENTAAVLTLLWGRGQEQRFDTLVIGVNWVASALV